MNGRSIFIVIINFDVIIVLLFVLHVEANLNSQKHSNAHLTTIVSFLKGHTLQYNLSQPTSIRLSFNKKYNTMYKNVDHQNIL